MIRKLTPEEMKKIDKEHVRILDDIGRQTQAKKDSNASFNELIKSLKNSEYELRMMKKTGVGVPQQLQLIPKDNPVKDFVDSARDSDYDTTISDGESSLTIVGNGKDNKEKDEK